MVRPVMDAPEVRSSGKPRLSTTSSRAASETAIIQRALRRIQRIACANRTRWPRRNIAGCFSGIRSWIVATVGRSCSGLASSARNLTCRTSSRPDAPRRRGRPSSVQVTVVDRRPQPGTRLAEVASATVGPPLVPGREQHEAIRAVGFRSAPRPDRRRSHPRPSGALRGSSLSASSPILMRPPFDPHRRGRPARPVACSMSKSRSTDAPRPSPARCVRSSGSVRRSFDRVSGSPRLRPALSRPFLP